MGIICGHSQQVWSFLNVEPTSFSKTFPGPSVRITRTRAASGGKFKCVVKNGVPKANAPQRERMNISAHSNLFSPTSLIVSALRVPDISLFPDHLGTSAAFGFFNHKCFPASQYESIDSYFEMSHVPLRHLTIKDHSRESCSGASHCLHDRPLSPKP